MCVQRSNPMVHDACMYRGPILWDSACTLQLHTHLRVCTPVQSQMRALFHVQKNSYMGTQHETYTGSSCNKNTAMRMQH